MSQEFNLSRLMASINELKKASYQEIEVSLYGKHFVLGILSSEETAKVHEYCSQFTTTLPFALNMQIETLAYAIKGLDGEYFGNVKMWPSGEVDSQGNEKKIEKHKFWRRIVGSFSSELRQKLYTEYFNMEQEFTESVDSSFKFIEEEKPDLKYFKEQQEREEKQNQNPLRNPSPKPQRDNNPPTSQGSFERHEGEEIPMVDEDGNLTAEGRAYQRLLERMERGENIPGVERINPPEETEYTEDESEDPEEYYDDGQEDYPEELEQSLEGQDAETFDMNQQELMKKIQNRLKGGGIQNMTEATQMHQHSEQASPNREEIRKGVDPQQAASAFKKSQKNRIKPESVQDPSFGKRNDEEKIPKSEFLRRQIQEQRSQNKSRPQKDSDEEIGLTSASRPYENNELPSRAKKKSPLRRV